MPFTVQNRLAADFASLAASPNVEVLTDDFNGDGTSDLALVNHAAGWATVPVALSNATGFTVENQPAAGFASLAASPSVVAVAGDFNGDGTADLALINQSAGWNTVPVALSSATGFTVENRSAAGFASLAANPDVDVLAEDFNGDGTTDLALINHAAGWTTIPIALSSATGFTFENLPAAGFASLAASPDVEPIAGDFNGDGTADIALINHAAGWTSIPVALSFIATGFTVENRPAAGFASLAASPNVEVLADDFNDDGTTDLALVNHAAGWNSIPTALSTAAGFTAENPIAADFASLAASPGVAAFAGDFNGDGRGDLSLVNTAAGWNSVVVALNLP